jgi:processive 1,2-diacylglycerol beta-glucosyltransferase
MAYLKSKGLYRGKLVIVFSDYHLHEFWLYDEADLYICNIVEQVEQLKRLGVAPERIKLTGTLVAQKFFQPISHEQAVQTLSLLSSMPIVLMGGAGHARSSVKEVFLQLLRSPKSFQIAVVCGNNAQLKEELGKISAPSRHPVKIYGYVDNMEVLMSAASVLVYKTGGPTMAEAVIKKLPMVLTDIHPGHEAWNLQYLIQNGIAKYARIPREVVFMVEQILDGKLAIDHEKNFAQIVRPTGSISIVEAINEINPEPDKKIVKNYQQN